MNQTTTIPVQTRTMTRVGGVLSGLATAFLLFDGVAKILRLAPVLEACAKLDVPEWVLPQVGIILVVFTLLYALPATSLFGALFLTGYLGGATWTHVRMGGPVFPMIFPTIFATIIWGALYLRNPRLRALVRG